MYRKVSWFHFNIKSKSVVSNLHVECVQLGVEKKKAIFALDLLFQLEGDVDTKEDSGGGVKK